MLSNKTGIMRIISLTTIVLTATFGAIMGIFISPTTGGQALFIEGILLGASVGVMIGSIISFSNLLAVRDFFRRIIVNKFPVQRAVDSSELRQAVVRANRKRAAVSM